MSDKSPPFNAEGQETLSESALREVAAVERFLGMAGQASAEAPSAPTPPIPTLGAVTGSSGQPVIPPPGYEILGQLGRGGMGAVYKARHRKLNRIVALKMILAGGYAGPSERVRFLAEAEVAAALRHPNLVALLEYGEHQGLPFFTLEYMPGGSLAERLKGVPQPGRAAARLVEQLARGIHHAHTHGVVHRDLKPSNVLIAEDGTPKISDFGLARRESAAPGLTATGEILGTPSYMAPEQAGGGARHAGAAADVYALGAILYECLTGRPPFHAASTMETLLQVMGQEPVSVRQLQAQTPADLATICHKCLQKEPDKRYASALELAEDCAAFLAGKPIRARPVGALSRGWRWCRRNPALAGALSLVALSLLLGSILSLTFAFRAEAARKSAEAARESEAERAESEARAKDEADEARRGAQRQSVDLCVASGLTAAKEGDHSLALLWFARAAQLAKDEPQLEKLNRIRIANWLRQVWLPEGRFDVPGFQENKDRFRQFQFSPDGNYLLVVASTGHCLVWDRRRGQLVRLPKAAAKATAAAWQPRSNLLAVAEKSGRIRFLAAPDFRPVDEVAAGGPIAVLAFSRDGKRLAWGGSDGARVWDRVKKVYLTPLLPHAGQVLTLSFSSTGELLATAGSDSKARVFRVSLEGSGPLFPPVRHVRPEDVYSHGGADRAAPRFAAGDQVLLTVEGDGGDNSFLIWRSSITGKLLGRSAEGAVFAVSEPGNLVASHAGPKGRLLDARTREVLAPMRLSGTGLWNEHIVFSADGRTLVTCGSDTRARFWSVEDRSDVALIESHPSVYHPMRAVRVSLTANQQHLATALWNGAVYLWRLPPGPPIAYQAHAGGSTVPALTADRQFVMPKGVTFREGNQLETRVYDARTGKPAGQTLDPGGILLNAEFSPDGTKVATASSTGRTPFERSRVLFAPDGKGGNVQIWDWRTGKRLVGPIPTPGEPRGLAFRPDGSSLAVVCADYRVLLVDPKTGNVKHRLDPGLRTQPNNANQHISNGEARFSPDGRLLLTWEMTPHVHVWDPDSGKLLHTLRHTERVRYVAFSSTVPHLLATAGWGSEARVWDLRTGKLLASLNHPRWVLNLSFSPDAKQLVTVAADGLLRSWDWRAEKLRDGRAYHDQWFGFFEFTSDWRWLVTVGDDEMQVIDWPSKIPVSPRWKTKPQIKLGLEIPAGDSRAIVGGFSPWMVGYDLKAMQAPATDRTEDLVALVELAAGRRILSEGNIVPLNSTEWEERWEKVQKAGVAALKKPAADDRRESQAWFDLGDSLQTRKDWPAASDAFKNGLAIDPNNAPAWFKLGNSLHNSQDRPAAIEAYRKALALEPSNAQAWYNLGNSLRLHEDRPAAIDAYKKAIAIAPLHAEAYCNLGITLRDQGDFAPALMALQKGHDIGRRRPYWPYASAAWVQQCQRLLELEKRIPDALQGRAAGPAEYREVADLCLQYKRRYRDALWLYEKALAGEPNPPPQAFQVGRYNAACAAALLAAGREAGAKDLPNEEKAELRAKALGWLTTELTRWRKLLDTDPPAAADRTPKLDDWLTDADLVSVRDARALARLPLAEQPTWRKLWAEVDSLTKAIRNSHTTTTLHGTLTTAQREQAHPLAMSAGKTYVIDMASARCRTHVRLEDGQGKTVAQGKQISLNNRGSRVVFGPKSDGTYRVVASSFLRLGTGGYALTIRTFAPQGK
jgi:WD40 repeat protein/tetratricopeptide (TPR) repeat protein/tRNA A-37 threonylcarbamoyl transferase component Bud32